MVCAPERKVSGGWAGFVAGGLGVVRALATQSRKTGFVRGTAGANGNVVTPVIGTGRQACA